MGIDLNLYEEEKSKLKVIVCDKCKEEFLLESVNIEKLIVNDKNNGLYFECRYFVCKKCGQPYLICIDDFLSIQLEQLYLSQRERVVRRKKRGKLKESDVERLEKKRRNLLKRRKLLLDNYGMAFTEIAKQNELGKDKLSTVTNNTEKE